MSNWKNIKIPSGSKLFQVHTFNFMYNGVNYIIEIDEFSDGSFTAHGEHSTDKNYVVESVSGNDLLTCLSGMIKKIEERSV